MLNSEKIANSIDEGLLFFWGIGVPYNNWDYDFRLLVGPVYLKKEVVQNGLVREKGSEGTFLNAEFSGGRNVFKSKRHRLAPSGGFAASVISPY